MSASPGPWMSVYPPPTTHTRDPPVTVTVSVPPLPLVDVACAAPPSAMMPTSAEAATAASARGLRAADLLIGRTPWAERNFGSTGALRFERFSVALGGRSLAAT